MTSAPNHSEGPAPAVLYGPLLGFHNLAGAAADADLTMDRDALAPIFRGPVVEAAKRPRCNVLFLYCAFDADGRVAGADQHFPDIVKACGARFAVVVPSGVAPSPTSAITDSDWAADLIFVLIERGRDSRNSFNPCSDRCSKGTLSLTLGSIWRRRARSRRPCRGRK
jgi:hypothetical protein